MSGSLPVPRTRPKPRFHRRSNLLGFVHTPGEPVDVEERPRTGRRAQAPGAKLWTILGCSTVGAAGCACVFAGAAIGVRSTAARSAGPPLARRACERRVGGIRGPSLAGRGVHAGSGRRDGGGVKLHRLRASRITVPGRVEKWSMGCFSAQVARRPTILDPSTSTGAISAAPPCPTSSDSTSSSGRVGPAAADFSSTGRPS